MRILLVDDDASVVLALQTVLKTLSGHELRTAGSGDEALAVAAELGGVDLLITDVVMEPMDGFTLRDHLLAQYPAVRTILISGYDLSEYPEQIQNHQLLGKPVDADALRDAVNKEAAAAPVAEPASIPEPEAVSEPAPAPVEAAEPPAAPAPVAPPVPVAAPSAPAAPAAVPVAVPVARPVAVPVAAKPVAVPVARPTAVPVARPAVVATPAAAPPAVKATPSVRATAVPTPTAAPTPTAVPQPTVPQATPKAVPAGNVPKVAVATPRAVPAAQPAVTVKATAVPQPSAVAPSPVATPAPQAAAPATPPAAAPAPGTPPTNPTVRVAATVRAQAVPPPSVPGGPAPAARPVAVNAPNPAVPTAKPAAVPTPQAKSPSVPAAVPRPSAVQTKSLAPASAPPSTTAPSTVVAKPVSSAGTPFSAPSLDVQAPAFSGEDLSGQMLGAYQLIRKLGEGRWGGIYAGMQTSINRAVAIEVLDSTKAADETAQGRFVADARAKAAVQHPSILAVYEAGEAEGRFFYAYEYVDGQTITELKAAGQRLDEVTALKVLRVAADGLSYFNVHHTPHTPPDAGSISLGADGHPRLANLATQLSDETLTPAQEIQALGRVMLGVLPAIQSLSPGLRDMLKRMVQAGPQALSSWGQLLQSIKALEPKIVPTDAAKISAQDRAAIAAVELARKQQKRSLYYNLASVVTLLLLVAFTVWYFLRNKQRVANEYVHVPAGEFVFANGEKKTLPEFWIGKYEVTIGEYAEFVRALEKRPTTEYDHKDQPRLKGNSLHKPPNWAIYYGQAAVNGKARSIPVDLSCPVMEVDFWDAYAYAKWKGVDLPTEEEWEKAARGTSGFHYPWGSNPDESKVNSNRDHNPNDPAAVGAVDGFNFWNPVDKVAGDKSPFGVMGMAGNVREWTGTWLPSKKVIVKGGSFMTADARLDQRTELDASALHESIGFRTVSRTRPE